MSPHKIPLVTTAEQRLLLAHVLEVPVSRLAIVETITDEQFDSYQQLLSRRSQGVPVQHLTGKSYFRNISVLVGPGVFIPRPETEVLVGWALQVLSNKPNAVVVELCTGSGVISKALADEAPGLNISAVELSEAAMAYAVANLSGSGVDLQLGDMADAFPDLNGKVDLVIANPPYIPLEAWESVPTEVRDYDPDLALFSGQDGLDALKVVAKTAKRLLSPGGLVGAEHAEVQSQSVIQLFQDAGFVQVRDNLDLTNRPRFVTAAKPKHDRMAS